MTNNQQEKTTKNWWGAVWRGLVVDETGKHYYSMRGALWLFVYIIIHADRKTGRVIRRYRTIAEDMHIKPRTVRKWLATLRQFNYVLVVRTGRSLVIHIQKWKPLTADT